MFSNYIAAQCFKRLVASLLAPLVLVNIGVLPALAASESVDGSRSSEASAVTSTKTHFSPHDNTYIGKYLKKNEYIPLSEIKPGMEGYGLSVFQGTKVEKFQVKVIGVIKKVLSGRDAILVRCSGLALGKNNVVRGMSGSPIYIDGRLAGALSYGFDFSKEPIVGITPVTDMLEALSFDDQPGATDRKVSSLHRPAFISVPREMLHAGSNPASASSASSSDVHMVPLMAPVSLAGFSPRAQDFLKDKFKDVALSISSGASGALDSALSASVAATVNSRRLPVVKQNAAATIQKAIQKHAATKQTTTKQVATPGPIESIEETVAEAESGTVKLVPGGAVAVLLSTGDFSSSATGTATCIFGNKVIAFGHAFMDAGQVAFPMATAYIHDILPSLSVSFKLSSPLQVIGTIFADRPWSIGGEIGRYSTLIPLTISVTDEKRHVKKTYHCQVVDHPELTPGLITATMMSALDSTYQSEVPNVIKLSSSIEIKNHGKLARTDRFAANFPAHINGDALSRLKSVSDPVSGYMGTLVDRLMGNDYEPASITNVAVDVVVEDGRHVAKIDRISVDKPVVAPGDTVNVNVVMKPFARPAYTEKLSFVIPREMPDGDIAIGISGGDELDNLRKRLGIVEPQSENLKQAIARIMRKERGDTLCGVMALPTQSISYNGDVLKNPPAHWVKLFFSDRSTKVPSIVRGEERARILLDDLVDGSHIIAVTVKRPDKIFAKSSPFLLNPTQSAHPSDGVFITEQARKAISSFNKPDTTASTSGGSSSSSTSTASTSTASTPTTSTSSKETTASVWSQAHAYPHMRAISLWRQDSESDFHNGKTDGIAIDSLGHLTPGFRELSRFTLDQEPRIWASVFTRGKFYFAAGSKLMSTTGESPTLVATLPGMIISSMAADSKGNIYAASAPGGEVFIVDEAGGIKPYAKVSESIVSALACDNSGRLYMGTSGSGNVYRGDSGTPVLVFDSNQAHITALSYSDRENKLYVGTAEKGCVYSIDSVGKVKAEFETGEHIVTGMARDKSGCLYITTAGTGKLFRVQPNGQAEPVAISDAFYTLYYDKNDDHIYTGDGEGDITRVEVDPLNGQALFVPVCHTEQDAIMALKSDGNGKLFCGTSNIAQVRSFEIQPTGDPSYSSTVQDAQRPANWSRLRLADIKDDNSTLVKVVKVATRGGETSQPDGSWSPWVDAVQEGDGYVIKSGPSRFLQYKLVWKLSDKRNVKDLVVARVDVTYQPTNLAPTIQSISLKFDESLSGTAPIVVTGSDVDQDNMLMSLELSDDDGKTWKTLVSDQRSRPSESEKAKKKAKEAASAAKALEKPAADAAKKVENAKATTAASDKKVEKKSEDKSAPDKGDELKPETKKSEDKTKTDSRSGIRKLEEGPVGNTEEPEQPATPATPATPSTPATPANPASSQPTSGAASKDKAKEKKEEKEEAKSNEQYSQTEKFTYNFETKKMKDGKYLMRVVVSDKPSNPENEKSVTAIRSVVVDNTPPQITDIKLSKKGDAISVKVTAHDNASYISDATYRIDAQEAFALAPAAQISEGNSLSDSHTATLVADNVRPEKGAKKITIQVFDRAGNSIKKTENLP